MCQGSIIRVRPPRREEVEADERSDVMDRLHLGASGHGSSCRSRSGGSRSFRPGGFGFAADLAASVERGSRFHIQALGHDVTHDSACRANRQRALRFDGSGDCARHFCLGGQDVAFDIGLFAENQRSHVKAVQDLAGGVNEFTAAVKEFASSSRRKRAREILEEYGW